MRGGWFVQPTGRTRPARSTSPAARSPTSADPRNLARCSWNLARCWCKR